MKNPNSLFQAMLLALAFALTPIVQAERRPDGGPIRPRTSQDVSANSEASFADSTRSEDDQFPAITIHSTGDVGRGKTGSFVLKMDPAVMLGGMYVNFKVSGTAVQGVDYVALVSPAYIGRSGYGVILVRTLPDPRGSNIRQAYSVVVTLEPGLGYTVSEPRSAKIMIKP